MSQLRARSTTANVSHWLRKSQRPRILHVFDHACNLINEKGDVLSIVDESVGEGPFHLVVPQDTPFPQYVQIDSEIYLQEDLINLGALRVDIRDANVWNSRPDWRKLYQMRSSIREALSPFRVDTGTLPKDFTSSFSSALARADISCALTGASNLAGLGPGLTPAGDDYLTGAIYSAWIFHTEETAQNLAKQIAAHAAPRTTSLSAAYLKAAGRGHVIRVWHGLLESVVVGDTSATEASIGAILSIGETSGQAAFAGFWETMACSKEKSVL